MILTGLFSNWLTKCHIMKAGIQAGLCVILGIYNTLRNDSFVLLMNTGVLPRLAGDIFQKPCAYAAEADSPPRGIAEKPPSLTSASTISFHKEHHRDDLFWGKRSISTLHPIKYQTVDINVWYKGIIILFQAVYCHSDGYEGIYELTFSKVLFLMKH